MDTRLDALKDWTARVLGAGRFDIRPASADASFRRYFRVTAGQQSLIAMDAPPDKGGMRSYVAIARRFHALGLNVPEVLEENHDLGFFLITDLGDRLYLRHLSDQTVERLYGDAMGALVVLQAGSFTQAAGKFLPDYDEVLLQREMEIFREWYLGRHLGLKLAASQQAALDETFTLLARAALSQPQVWVHRDYHSRNLMVTDRNNPGILDFQDAVLGPVTYDLVSLLRDCYIAWPRARVEDWVKGYHELALQSGIPVGDDDNRFLRWFDLMGVQRHLKATGIFARLNHRDNKPGYLSDIPRTLGYVQEVSARYPELQPLNALLREFKLTESA
ncbi:aminoglycoside phosphotransferase family protein [Sulfuricaulis sp.]|uniref:aminoglycoside phosphotransferase family protein n=1 Tax=Sulfuricaulis sp. TaxID=2003553 RepID=UPI003559DF83